jgi:phosphoglycolate phosphatase-like HAD superfamily hydrolase
MLVLFDIDGTLLRSQGAGVAAMQQTFDELYPDRGLSMRGVPVAGRLDTLIWTDVLRSHGLEPSEAEAARFRARYAEVLAERLSSGEAGLRLMPGVHELVERLAAEPDCTVGLLTGNWIHTARIKLEAAGFVWDRFRLGAFADDGPDRRALPPVAMRRFEAFAGRGIDPQRVAIIGDTPMDVDCAKHNGCRAVAVATGDYGVDALAETGADLVLPDLGAIAEVVEWLRSASH